MKEILQKTYQKLAGKMLSGGLNPISGSAKLFEIGYNFDRNGEHDSADYIYLKTVELIESLSESSKILSIADLAQIAFEHGRNLENLGRHNLSRFAFKQAINIYDSLLHYGCSQKVAFNLAESLSWLAITELNSGKISESYSTHKRAINIWKQLILFNSEVEIKKVLIEKLDKTLSSYNKLINIKTALKTKC